MNATFSETKVRLISSPRSWIEGEAVRQLYATAKLKGVQCAVGFPDLHPGKGTPVGAAFVTQDLIYPHLIGGDIGCGMALFRTTLTRGKAKLDRWAELPFNLEHAWNESLTGFLLESGLESTEFDEALGTIGGGNHFAEVQTVERVFDAEAFNGLGIAKQQLVMLIHSGSRGLGEAVLRDHVEKHRAAGVTAASEDGQNYLRRHDFAVRWARANRALIARRFAGTLRTEVECLWDGCHNSIQGRAGVLRGHSAIGAVASDEHAGRLSYVHRKGAVDAQSGMVMIPGSRGTLSYLVKPAGDGESHAWSLAHGAGRKWTRSESRARMRERFSVMELVQTILGSRVVCEQRELLYEEAPAAYKNIEIVIQDLVEAGLVSVIATFRPLLTYKTRKVLR